MDEKEKDKIYGLLDEIRQCVEGYPTEEEGSEEPMPISEEDPSTKRMLAISLMNRR